MKLLITIVILAIGIIIGLAADNYIGHKQAEKYYDTLVSQSKHQAKKLTTFAKKYTTK